MIKTAKELAAAAESVAKKHKTLYVNGCFGWPMTATMKARAKREQSYNRKADRAAKIDAAGTDVFGFDCVCFIKALLWGWVGDVTHNYGGAAYKSNGVHELTTGQMIGVCKDVSSDFTAIAVGEVLWKEGHVGIYIGNGLAVEATPSWKDGVQITAVHNIGKKTGYNGRTWTKHGKLPYVSYPAEAEPVESFVAVKLPVLKRGDKNGSVKALQALLIGYGYKMTDASGKVYGADGSFGGATERAVEAYQTAKKLKEKKTVGAETWARLLGV